MGGELIAVMLFFGVILALPVVLVCVAKLMNEAEDAGRQMDVDIPTRHNLNAYFRRKHSQTFIGVRISQCDIVLGSRESTEFLPVNTLLTCEVIRDETSLIKVDRGSQLAGAAVGALAAGGIGAVIGGLSANRNQVNRIARLALTMRFARDVDPCRTYIFFDGPIAGVDRRDPELTRSVAAMDVVYTRILAMMKGDQPEMTPGDPGQDRLALLERLSKLRAEGHLSAEEFAAENSGSYKLKHWPRRQRDSRTTTCCC